MSSTSGSIFVIPCTVPACGGCAERLLALTAFGASGDFVLLLRFPPQLVDGSLSDHLTGGDDADGVADAMRRSRGGRLLRTPAGSRT